MAESASTDAEKMLKSVNEKRTRRKLRDADFDSVKFREYRHDHPKRGRAVIANFHEFLDRKHTRHGSEVDVQRIRDILQNQLKFEVDTWETDGVERDEFLAMVLEEAARPEHEESDCFLMVLMTHGNKGGALSAFSTKFKLDEVVESFTGDKCPALCGKPKIFIVQACRGDSSQTGVPKVICKGPSPLPPPDMISLPTHSDIIIAQSQYEGFYSIRNLKKGSYFIQALCDILEHDIKKPDEKKDDLLHLLTLTSHCVAQFEFLEYSEKKPGDGTDGGCGGDVEDSSEQGGVIMDTTASSEGPAPGDSIETDAKPFDPPPTPGPTPQAKLVKQQPTIVSTMLKLYYMRSKDAQTNDNGAKGRRSRRESVRGCTLS